jgi:hypothetical protein
VLEGARCLSPNVAALVKAAMAARDNAFEKWASKRTSKLADEAARNASTQTAIEAAAQRTGASDRRAGRTNNTLDYSRGFLSAAADVLAYTVDEKVAEGWDNPVHDPSYVE